MNELSRLRSGFKEGVKNFGENINSIITFVLLSFVYFIGVGLTSIVAKISGKHFLDMKAKKTYWISLNPKKKPIEAYYRQF
jgi:hypothetical protein